MSLETFVTNVKKRDAPAIVIPNANGTMRMGVKMSETTVEEQEELVKEFRELLSKSRSQAYNYLLDKVDIISSTSWYNCLESIYDRGVEDGDD